MKKVMVVDGTTLNELKKAFNEDDINLFFGILKNQTVDSDSEQLNGEQSVGGDSNRTKTDATSIMLNERGSRYGKFENQAKVSCKLEEAFFEGLMNNLISSNPEILEDNNLETTFDDLFPPYMKEAIKLILHKIARIANGDPYYDDSWKDIAGYATLVVEILHEREANNGK